MTVATKVVAKARRRRFTAAEKLRVLPEADSCTKPCGARGCTPRTFPRGGAAPRNDELAELAPRGRGPKPKPVDPCDRKIAELELENRRLQVRLERADGLFAVREKASQLLGISLEIDGQA